MTDILFLVGRVLFGGYFVMNGTRHLLQRAGLVAYAQAKGVPSPVLSVLVTGLLLVGGGLGVVLGILIPWAVAALAVFLIGVTLKMHAFWTVQDPMARMGDEVNFWKNLALLGAALMLLAIPTPWAFAL